MHSTMWSLLSTVIASLSAAQLQVHECSAHVHSPSRTRSPSHTNIHTTIPHHVLSPLVSFLHRSIPRQSVLDPYTMSPTPTLLFFNAHAKGNYFLPSSVRQLLLVLDGLLLVALPFYAIGVTYYWSYQQAAAVTC